MGLFKTDTKKGLQNKIRQVAEALEKNQKARPELVQKADDAYSGTRSPEYLAAQAAVAGIDRDTGRFSFWRRLAQAASRGWPILTNLRVPQCTFYRAGHGSGRSS